MAAFAAELVALTALTVIRVSYAALI